MLAKAERLRMSGITKKFGDLAAIDQVDIALNHGEIHAIVGENGAGKTTLMRVLAGHMPATAGSMVLEGEPARIDRAMPGQRPTVGFLEQEGGLVTELTGTENLILAEARGLWSNRKEASARLRELATRFGGAIDPDVPVVSLPMGQRQRLEILVILARGANILILDEPTASLSVEDAKTLGEIMRRFVAGGGSVFYISHKLNEVREIADRITVMRRGKVVGRHAAHDVTVGQLAAEMVGEFVAVGARAQASGGQPSDGLIDVALGVRGEVHYDGPSREICVLRGVSVLSGYKSESALSDIDLTVRAGEVVGVAGVVGSGQTVLAETLAGLLSPHSRDDPACRRRHRLRAGEPASRCAGAAADHPRQSDRPLAQTSGISRAASGFAATSSTRGCPRFWKNPACMAPTATRRFRAFPAATSRSWCWDANWSRPLPCWWRTIRSGGWTYAPSRTCGTPFSAPANRAPASL